jgi:pyruvate-formate lyase-activating enzyme
MVAQAAALLPWITCRQGMKSDSPRLIISDSRCRIVDFPHLKAGGRSGDSIVGIDPGLLIPLPPQSQLFSMPGRLAVGIDDNGAPVICGEGEPVAAFLPPGYTAILLAASKRQAGAPMLPLFCYAAVCWYRGRYHAAARRVDNDPKHDASLFNMNEVRRNVRKQLRAFPWNRLLRHHGQICALNYRCPNAVNLFLQRWEAPAAVAMGCNSACRGCISHQSGSIKSPQERISFTPTVREIVGLAVPHLERAERAMISFGQGCEGEPLTRAGLLIDAIKEIRRQTRRGVIHINTNGSRPHAVAQLIEAGLDSIRISMNSVREPLYTAYYRPAGYTMRDVVKSFKVARSAGIWISMNYLTFPGVTDCESEASALEKFVERQKPDMIQWRNLNMDPDSYMKLVRASTPAEKKAPRGMKEMWDGLEKRFPALRHGYFNPPITPRRAGIRRSA